VQNLWRASKSSADEESARFAMAEQFDYGGPQKQMTIPRGSLPFLAAIYALCVALDAINIVGLPINPQAVTRFACAIWPLALIQPPNLFTNVSQFVATQCLGEPREPVVSIIFFSIKLTMAAVAILILWGYTALKPETFLQRREMYEQRFDKAGGCYQEFKKFAAESVGKLIFFFCSLLLTFSFVSEPILRFDVLEKVLGEDMLAVLIPTMLFSISATLLVFILHALKHRKTI
jgi:hypothetical protein